MHFTWKTGMVFFSWFKMLGLCLAMDDFRALNVAWENVVLGVGGVVEVGVKAGVSK